jgi:hypothetical protein
MEKKKHVGEAEKGYGGTGRHTTRDPVGHVAAALSVPGSGLSAQYTEGIVPCVTRLWPSLSPPAPGPHAPRRVSPPPRHRHGRGPQAPGVMGLFPVFAPGYRTNLRLSTSSRCVLVSGLGTAKAISSTILVKCTVGLGLLEGKSILEWLSYAMF